MLHPLVARVQHQMTIRKFVKDAGFPSECVPTLRFVSTEVWFRNPHLYVRECEELGVQDIAWDRGFLMKFNIDPSRFMTLYYGRGKPWRNLLIGEQGATEYTYLSPQMPTAVYPVWTYGDNLSFLEDALANPVGDDPALCADPDTAIGLRPVLGQEHRVVVTGLPSVNNGPVKKFLRVLAQLQQDHPEAIIHVHAMYSFQFMFGLGFGAVDVDPRTDAKKGKIILPMGKAMKYEQATQYPQWVSLLGFRLHDLKIPRKRCMYNMKSALWAGAHYQEQIKFVSRGYVPVDPDAALVPPPSNNRIMVRNVKPQPGDKFACDLCSLQTTCKYFRTGAVCVVPDSEPKELAQYFHTRDSDTIIEGLGTLLAAETRRLKRGMEMEEIEGKLDPEVTKIIVKLFDQGVKLAKLVDPSLRANPTVNFKLTQNNATIQAATPQQLMAAVVAELEARGVPRAAITPDMVQRILEQPDDVRQRAIEAAVAETA